MLQEDRSSPVLVPISTIEPLDDTSSVSDVSDDLLSVSEILDAQSFNLEPVHECDLSLPISPQSLYNKTHKQLLSRESFHDESIIHHTESHAQLQHTKLRPSFFPHILKSIICDSVKPKLHNQELQLLVLFLI